MPRYKLTIEYNGAPYSGWQIQDDRDTVQGKIEEAFVKYYGSYSELFGAGRTDSGVHATAQIAHIDIEKDVDPFSVMQGINFYLFNPNGKKEATDVSNRIAIINAERVDDAFHARFSATKRHYLYRIINRRARLGLEAGRAWHVITHLDEQKMHDAAQLLVGHHDFTSFRDTECQAKSPVRTLEQLDIRRVDEEIHVHTSSRSFLHHQVRIIVGTLALVGRGKWSKDDVQKALEATHRTKAGPTAPADGLYLTAIDY